MANPIVSGIHGDEDEILKAVCKSTQIFQMLDTVWIAFALVVQGVP